MPNSKPSDVYAWACVLYEIFTGDLPFFECSRDSVVMLKVLGGERPSRPLPVSMSWTEWGLTEEIWSLMHDCWRATPAERPTIRDAKARLPVDERQLRQRMELVRWNLPSRRAYSPGVLEVEALDRLLAEHSH